MNILICEDEAPARKHISKMISEIKEDAHIVDSVETGEEAQAAIRKYELDLIFMDVELADGPCFETLDNVEIQVPIVFTTAYDEYALKAFKLNSIDYLVKPISKQDIEKAFQKYESIRCSFDNAPDFTFSREVLAGKNYKERFLVKLGRKLFPIHTNEIAYFTAKDKYVWLVTNERKKYIINYTLSDLEDLLDPEVFFRLNRQYIANIKSVSELEPYFKGQVVAKLKPETDDEIVISRQQTPLLKTWLSN